MAYSVAVKVAAHQALLDLLATGSGDATLDLLAGATPLASLPIDHAASEVDAETGQLTLASVEGGTTADASGTVTVAQLIARDGAVLEDAIPVSAGVDPVAGRVVLSSLNLISGAQVDLISATIG